MLVSTPAAEYAPVPRPASVQGVSPLAQRDLWSFQLVAENDPRVRWRQLFVIVDEWFIEAVRLPPKAVEARLCLPTAWTVLYCYLLNVNRHHEHGFPSPPYILKQDGVAPPAPGPLSVLNIEPLS